MDARWFGLFTSLFVTEGKVAAGFSILDRVRNLSNTPNINFRGPNKPLLYACCPEGGSHAQPASQCGDLCEPRSSFRISRHRNWALFGPSSLMFGAHERCSPLSTIAKPAVTHLITKEGHERAMCFCLGTDCLWRNAQSVLHIIETQFLNWETDLLNPVCVVFSTKMKVGTLTYIPYSPHWKWCCLGPSDHEHKIINRPIWMINSS